MWGDLKSVYRFPILFLGMVSLIVGILAGIGRLGTVVPQIALQQVVHHGVLMVPAFFGTVIGLERAVAIGQRWAYLAPLLTGLGGILLLAAQPAAALVLLAAGTLVFLIASARVLRIQWAVHNLILLAGALSLLIGNLLLLAGVGVNEALYWWIAFLVLTIAGERLELSRLVVRSQARRVLLALLAAVPLAGAALRPLDSEAGLVLFAAGLAGIGLWLLLFDIARRTVRQQGLTRFTAVCMLAGYAWLLTSAALFVAYQFGLGEVTRDAPLHSLFLGFVFSMVIGHALIIFPAVTQLKIPYSPLFYLPLVLLQASLLIRVAGGVTGHSGLLLHGGHLNGVTLGLFILTLVWSIARGQLKRSRR